MAGRPPTTKLCSIDGCTRKHYGAGYCRPHFYRWKRNGDPGKAQIESPRGKKGVPPGGHCCTEGCNRFAAIRGYCNAHYIRLLNKGETGSAEVRQKRGKGKGGRWKDRNGYILVSNNGVRKAEHRLVMERQIGRPLRPDESVHHINGIRDDNRLENLELWVRSHPTGQRVEDVVAWAREILARYGDDF